MPYHTVSVVPLLDITPVGVPGTTVTVVILGSTTLTPVTRFVGFATSLLAPAAGSGVTDEGEGAAVPGGVISVWFYLSVLLNTGMQRMCCSGVSCVLRLYCEHFFIHRKLRKFARLSFWFVVVRV